MVLTVKPCAKIGVKTTGVIPTQALAEIPFRLSKTF
jgi:hypothetical protein